MKNFGAPSSFWPDGKVPFVAHRLDQMDQLHRVDVEDVLGLGIVAEFLVIAGQAEHVAHPQRRGPEQVGLQGDAVAVAHHHLQQGLDPHLLEQHAAGDRAHPHHRGLVVGDVAGVDVALDIGRLLPHDLRIGARGGPHSAVTAKWPAARTFSRLLPAFIRSYPP